VTRASLVELDALEYEYVARVDWKRAHSGSHRKGSPCLFSSSRRTRDRHGDFYFCISLFFSFPLFHSLFLNTDLNTTLTCQRIYFPAGLARLSGNDIPVIGLWIFFPPAFARLMLPLFCLEINSLADPCRPDHVSFGPLTRHVN
jgi:hypothetical protein